MLQVLHPTRISSSLCFQSKRSAAKSGAGLTRFVILIFAFLPGIVLAEPLRVFVSVLPMQTFVEKIGGEHVDVRVMVQPGYSPATYAPMPQQITALAKAVLYIRTGVPFEQAWMERIRSANPAMQILDVRSGIQLRTMEAHDHGSGHAKDDHKDQHELDPHVWTSPLLVKQMAGLIRDKLAELDPRHRENYVHGHRAFVRELDDLDRQIHALLEPLQYRKFMVFHPAWGYFADAYGLIQVPIEREGKEPGPRALAALIDQAKKEKVRVIFVQPQFAKRYAMQVADAIGGQVIAVDPLALDYIDNLRRVAQEFAKVLQP